MIQFASRSHPASALPTRKALERLVLKRFRVAGGITGMTSDVVLGMATIVTSRDVTGRL